MMASQQQQQQQYGVTEPLSTSGPMEPDLLRNRDLIKVLYVCVCVRARRPWELGLRVGLLLSLLLSYEICSFFAQFLANAGLYESQEEAVLREEVLGRLDQVDTSSGPTLSLSLSWKWAKKYSRFLHD